MVTEVALASLDVPGALEGHWLLWPQPDCSVIHRDQKGSGCSVAHPGPGRT